MKHLIFVSFFLITSTLSSSATIVATQGTNSLLRGENVNQAMGGIVNENTIKQVGVSVVTAGLLDKYGDQVTGKITISLVSPIKSQLMWLSKG